MGDLYKKEYFIKTTKTRVKNLASFFTIDENFRRFLNRMSKEHNGIKGFILNKNKDGNYDYIIGIIVD